MSAWADGWLEQAKAFLNGERVPPNVDCQPKLCCRLLGHLWTRAPFAAGRPMEGGRTTDAWWPYCSRCYQPRRPGLRGRSGDFLGWAGTAGRIDMGDHYAPSAAAPTGEKRS